MKKIMIPEWLEVIVWTRQLEITNEVEAG